MNRRRFLHASSALATSGLVSAASPAAKYRVAIIGHTGRGNYGHGLDTMWAKQADRTEVVGVADADAAGLEAALKKIGEGKGYADYRAMLEELKPDIVAIGPRHIDQHRDMTLAAVKAGAKGIYMEKPFCRTPAEADEIVNACAKAGARLALAHRNRYQPTLKTVEQIMSDGTLGNVLEIRSRGKEDARGGAEDMWVLGSHLFNLLAHLGGRPLNCSASVFQNRKPATPADINAEGKEGIGPMVGNEVHATFFMERGLKATFSSIQNKGERSAGFGVQIIGTKGIIDLRMDTMPFAHFLPGNPNGPVKGAREWIPISTVGIGKPEPQQALVDKVMDHQLAAEDLLEAMEQKREPLCSAAEGRTTVEMITAVFASHIAGGARVNLPLTSRENPLAMWR